MFLKKNKYCCYWFAVNHQQPKTSYCIRVVKYNMKSIETLEIYYADGDRGIRRQVKDSKIPCRFIYMEPLNPIKHPSLRYQNPILGLRLWYCPFCGTNLFTFYGKKRNIEDYVNEIEGVTF